MEKEADKNDQAIAEEQQQEQSVQDTQLPPPSPPHVATPPAGLDIVKDVPDTSGQNINPLNAEDLKKILHQTTLQSELCTNPVLVSVEELQRAMAEIKKKKVNPQEPPSQISTATTDQPTEKVDKETPAKVDASATQDLQGQKDTSVSTAQTQSAFPRITIVDQGRREQFNEGESPKEKEEQVIQILANLPKSGTPTETQQQPSSKVLL